MERLIKTLLMPLSNKTILDSHCFVHELKKEMHDDLEYVKSLEKEIDELESEKADFSNIYDLLLEEFTQQNLPRNRNQAVQNTNVLKPGMFRIASTTTQTRTPQLPHASRNTNPHMSKSSGVIHTTSVSRPQLKCYQVKDKVVPNNSQVKFQKKEVEDHHRISSISKKTKSVTACNDSSNSRTSNENASIVLNEETCVLILLFLKERSRTKTRQVRIQEQDTKGKKRHISSKTKQKQQRKA
ncbi:hypothetical protein Tco_0305526 [Tanacetum coccineum]